LQVRLAAANETEPKERAVKTFRKRQIQTLHESIEKFARAYWALAPAKRQQMHARLLAGAKNVPLAKLRLESLSDGLAVAAVLDTGEDPTCALAAKIQALYVLPPIDRAVRRQELAESLQGTSGSAITFQLLQENFPEIARLEKSLSSQRVALPRKKTKPKLPRSKDLLPPGRHASSSDGWFSGLSPSIGGRIGWVVLCLFLSGSVRACAQLTRPSSSPIPLLLPDQITALKTLHLKSVQHPDGTKSLEAFDQHGKLVKVSESTKRLLGSESTLKKEEELRKTNVKKSAPNLGGKMLPPNR
jgi:hypothetical protein